MQAVASEPSAISYACPRRENPVTSVAAWTVRPRAISRALLFRVRMLSMASVASVSPPLWAVIMTPTPRRFVRTRQSPSIAPEFVHTESLFSIAVTESPNFGSLSDIVWPPAITHPASFAFSIAPSIIERMTERSRQDGKHIRERATSGLPPMA